MSKLWNKDLLEMFVGGVLTVSHTKMKTW